MKIRRQKKSGKVWKSLTQCSSLLSMLCIVEYRSMILSGQPRGEGVQKGVIAGAGHDAGHFLAAWVLSREPSELADAQIPLNEVTR
ncbi:hypothetical protein PQR66_34550 [Paraburkholderia agricolaris]|uniref:Uncharacterized protein n=1 Tax=Paraburkholderia agricolaris TaxID=2152888 RepID=A0ABW8ZZJ8_9BURK